METGEDGPTMLMRAADLLTYSRSLPEMASSSLAEVRSTFTPASCTCFQKHPQAGRRGSGPKAAVTIRMEGLWPQCCCQIRNNLPCRAVPHLALLRAAQATLNMLLYCQPPIAPFGCDTECCVITVVMPCDPHKQPKTIQALTSRAIGSKWCI